MKESYAAAVGRRSFKICSTAIEFKFYFGGGTLICAAGCGDWVWSCKLRRRRRLERMALKFTPKLWALSARFKIYPEISAVVHAKTHATTCRFFVGSVRLKILNLAVARIYSGVYQLLNSADRAVPRDFKFNRQV